MFGFFNSNKQENIFRQDSSSKLVSKSCQQNSFEKDGVLILIKGEQYNYLTAKFIQLIYCNYINENLKNFLKNLDGCFNIAIFDKNKNKVYLISDQFGTRQIYYYYKNKEFAFCNKINQLLRLDLIDSSFDSSQLKCFMELGHLLEDNTWHKNIKLIKPSSILEFNIDSGILKQDYYWKWSETKDNNISFDEAVDQLGHLWIKAVKTRFDPNKNIGITLSGGLDSRAIFAAINKLYPEYSGTAYTFGVPGCDDIKIAKKCISLTNWNHKELYFKNKNWFEQRIETTLSTNGMLNLKHMHGIEFIESMSHHDTIFTGALGDVILGFSRMKHKQSAYDSRINNDVIKLFYNGFSSKEWIKDDFFNINKADPFLLMNDGRRFTGMGLAISFNYNELKIPFLDKNLVEFVYSLPDNYRENGKLYKAMLLKFFPEFFKKIPWQNTGYPISKTLSQRFIPVLKRRIMWRVKRYLYTKNILKNKNLYADYFNWIKEKTISDKLYTLLDRNKSEYSHYTSDDYIELYLKPHLEYNIDFSEKILLAATIEIYLRKLNSDFKLKSTNQFD